MYGGFVNPDALLPPGGDGKAKSQSQEPPRPDEPSYVRFFRGIGYAAAFLAAQARSAEGRAVWSKWAADVARQAPETEAPQLGAAVVNAIFQAAHAAAESFRSDIAKE